MPYRVTDGQLRAPSIGQDECRHARLSRALLDALDAPSCVVDARGVIVVVNDAWERLAASMGVVPTEGGVGRDYPTVCPALVGGDRAAADRLGVALRQVLDGTVDGCEVQHAGGEVDDRRWYLVRFRPLRQHEGAVVSHTDVTALVEAQEAMQEKSLHDPLTGLPTRDLLADRLQGALDRSERHGGLVGVFCCDLDSFGGVNDSLGRPAGDELLHAVGERLSGSLRSHDTVARLGGDEFVVVCEGLDELGVRELATRLHRVLGLPFPLSGGGSMTVGVSVGVATSQPHADAGALLEQAGAALTEAKRQGGARIVHHSSSTPPPTVPRAVLGSDLRGAAARGELVLGYQPVVDLRSGLVSGIETLLRWRHASLGVLPPSTFIPIAEQDGCIDELGGWVLLEACRFLASAQSEASQPMRVSVNVSARQLAGGALVGQVRDALAETKADASRLVLEFTETAVMEDAVRSSTVLEELHASGVRLAIDDFGTGYTSLTYLTQFPVHALKVDRSLIAALDRREEGGGIVGGVVHLAHSVGVLAVAEGVERRDQLELVRDLGCDLGQGFVWSRPVPRAQIGHAVAAIEGLAGVGDAAAAEDLLDDASVRRRIVAMHRAGASGHTIAAALNQAEVFTPRGTRWQAATVGRVIAEDLGPVRRA